MKNILKLGILGIFIICFHTSCQWYDLYYDWIWFENQSSYTISVNSDMTYPSSFTLNPVDGSLMVKTKITKINDRWMGETEPLKIDIKCNDNDNDHVRVVVRDGWIYFHNK